MRRRQPGAFSWAIFFRGIVRSLGLLNPSQARADAEDDWHRPDTTADQDRPSRLLNRIRDDALAVYAAHGLPTSPGHYAWRPGQAGWTLIAETLSPEERWAMLDQYPPQDGWRLAGLENLGRDSADEALAAAARVLSHVKALTSPDRRDSTHPGLERAVALGAEWRGLSAHGAPDIRMARPRPLDAPDD